MQGANGYLVGRDIGARRNRSRWRTRDTGSARMPLHTRFLGEDPVVTDSALACGTMSFGGRAGTSNFVQRSDPRTSLEEQAA